MRPKTARRSLRRLAWRIIMDETGTSPMNKEDEREERNAKKDLGTCRDGMLNRLRYRMRERGRW